MVSPAKVFQINEDADLGVIAQKLKDFREEETYETEDGETKKLATEVLDLELEEDKLTGVFSRDFVRSRYYRRGLVETLVTEEAPFWIREFKGQNFLVVLAPSVARGVKKLLTNHVANKLSEVLFLKSGLIVEAKIAHETLKELHESNPRATKLIWFDNIDFPDVGKLCLSGSALADTKLYQEYLDHGKIWYAVFEAEKYGFVVGVTRNCVITLFSKATVGEFSNYLLKEIIPLVEQE